MTEGKNAYLNFFDFFGGGPLDGGPDAFAPFATFLPLRVGTD